MVGTSKLSCAEVILAKKNVWPDEFPQLIANLKTPENQKLASNVQRSDGFYLLVNKTALLAADFSNDAARASSSGILPSRKLR